MVVLKCLLTSFDDQGSHAGQRELFAFSDLDQLVVDQAATLRIQFALDVIEERVAEMVQQVHIGGQVALVEVSELVIDLEAVNVPSDEEARNLISKKVTTT